ncbi:MAG: hypothetical protein Tsb004_15410 [Allomuricauda sp.]
MRTFINFSILFHTLLLCHGSFSQTLEIDRESQDLKVSKNLWIQNQHPALHYVESTIAVHPKDENTWAIASMVLDNSKGLQFKTQVSVTEDKGNSWSTEVFEDVYADPQLLFRNNGELIFIGLSGNGIKFYSSKNNGQSWDLLQELLGSFDHPFLYDFQGQISCVSSAKGNKSIYIDHNIDDGKEGFYHHFNNRFQQDNMQHLAQRDGDLIIPYFQYHVSQQGPVSDALYFITSESNSNTSNQPRFISKSSGVGKGFTGIKSHKEVGKFFSVVAVGRTKFDFDAIAVHQSPKKDIAWRTSMIYPDSERFYCPTFTINNQGIIALFWYGKDQENLQQGGDIYFTISKDQGESFSKPIIVNDKPQKPIAKEDGIVMKRFPGGGHYSGIASLSDGSFQLVWSDTRSGHYQLYTTNIKAIQ